MPEDLFDDPYYDPEGAPTPVDLGPYRAEILRLKTNWSIRNAPLKAAVDQWTKQASAWSLQQVERAVDRCIEQAEFEPKGFGDFAKFLPRRTERKAPMGWWSIDGSWGGDWSHAGDRMVLHVAAVFEVNRKPHLAKINLRKIEREGKLVETWDREEPRTSMLPHLQEQSQEFIKMALRRRWITRELLAEAASRFERGGDVALRSFVADPEGDRERVREQGAMVEGLRRLDQIGVGAA